MRDGTGCEVVAWRDDGGRGDDGSGGGMRCRVQYPRGEEGVLSSCSFLPRICSQVEGWTCKPWHIRICASERDVLGQSLINFARRMHSLYSGITRAIYQNTCIYYR